MPSGSSLLNFSPVAPAPSPPTLVSPVLELGTTPPEVCKPKPSLATSSLELIQLASWSEPPAWYPAAPALEKVPPVTTFIVLLIVSVTVP